MTPPPLAAAAAAGGPLRERRPEGWRAADTLGGRGTLEVRAGRCAAVVAKEQTPEG